MILINVITHRLERFRIDPKNEIYKYYLLNNKLN